MAALDALKRYNGFKRFHLVGQSGVGTPLLGSCSCEATLAAQ